MTKLGLLGPPFASWVRKAQPPHISLNFLRASFRALPRCFNSAWSAQRSFHFAILCLSKVLPRVQQRVLASCFLTPFFWSSLGRAFGIMPRAPCVLSKLANLASSADSGVVFLVSGNQLGISLMAWGVNEDFFASFFHTASAAVWEFVVLAGHSPLKICSMFSFFSGQDAQF